MKTLFIVIVLLALVIPAHAETCAGRVKIDVVTSDQGLYPKGYKQFSVGECVLEDAALRKRVLRTCPLGSWCRIEGTYAGDDAIETITSVTRRSEPKCKPVPMDGPGWLGVGGWRYATKACAMGPRTRPKDRILKQFD